MRYSICRRLKQAVSWRQCQRYQELRLNFGREPGPPRGCLACDVVREWSLRRTYSRDEVLDNDFYEEFKHAYLAAADAGQCGAPMTQ